MISLTPNFLCHRIEFENQGFRRETPGGIDLSTFFPIYSEQRIPRNSALIGRRMGGGGGLRQSINLNPLSYQMPLCDISKQSEWPKIRVNLEPRFRARFQKSFTRGFINFFGHVNLQSS